MQLNQRLLAINVVAVKISFNKTKRNTCARAEVTVVKIVGTTMHVVTVVAAAILASARSQNSRA